MADLISTNRRRGLTLKLLFELAKLERQKMADLISTNRRRGLTL